MRLRGLFSLLLPQMTQIFSLKENSTEFRQNFILSC